uniref:(northern house mosquito) hypothetical protein n=1 Tax=Culex pipiens TaxID=7175 RepID=A0A8D8APK5_CULPI
MGPQKTHDARAGNFPLGAGQHRHLQSVDQGRHHNVHLRPDRARPGQHDHHRGWHQAAVQAHAQARRTDSEGHARPGSAAGCRSGNLLRDASELHHRGQTAVGTADGQRHHRLHCGAGAAAGCPRRVASLGAHAQRQV